MEFAAIPEGTYDVGDAEYQDNPPREVTIDSFELATTPTTNRQMARAWRVLGAQDTVLMFGSVCDRHLSIVARGTKKEVADIELPALREAVAQLSSSGSKSAQRVVDFSQSGALQVFSLFPVSIIIPVTLEAHFLDGFDGPNQPALVSAFESSALAALFGLQLPTGEQWEVASGDLRDKKYWKEKELRRVAHFRPADATADVKSKAPNRYGLYDMLGNVCEATKDRYKEGWEDSEFRGGAWLGIPKHVRATFRIGIRPNVWLDSTGCRFARLTDSTQR